MIDVSLSSLLKIYSKLWLMLDYGWQSNMFDWAQLISIFRLEIFVWLCFIEIAHRYYVVTFHVIAKCKFKIKNRWFFLNNYCWEVYFLQISQIRFLRKFLKQSTEICIWSPMECHIFSQIIYYNYLHTWTYM